MKKILLIDINCKFSSTGKIVYDLYSQIRKGGNDAMVCYGRGEEVNEPNIHKIGIDLETYAHVALTRFTGFNGVFSPFSTQRLIKKIKEYQPDIVHIHELHGYFVNYAPVIKYLKENNIKTIWTFHCEYMYTGKCGQAFDCDKFKTECKECPYLKEYPKVLFFDWTKQMHRRKKELFDNFDNLTITTPSKWLYGRLKESFLKQKRSLVINNGIDNSNIFYPRDTISLKKKHNITKQKIVLAVAPKLMSSQKGGDYVVEVAKRLDSKNTLFILIGVDDLDIDFGNNVIALGRTKDQHELATYYSLADLFIICSSYENFPTTALEALSCGTNVIGFDSGGTKETAPSDYGYFVNYGDIEGIAKAIEDIFNNKIKLKNSQECRDFAVKNYSKEAMIKKYTKLYMEPR